MISTEVALTMTLINLDRFFFVCSPVFYEEYYTISIMKKLTAGSLVVSLLDALVFTFTPQLNEAVDYEAIIMLTLFCVLFTATCVIIAVKLVKAQHLLGLYRYYRVPRQDRISFTKDFLVAFLLSLTYIAFYCIPAPWYLLHMKETDVHVEDPIIVYEAIEAGYVLVYVLHPVLCITLIKEFRDKVVNQCLSSTEDTIVSKTVAVSGRGNFNKASVRSNVTGDEWCEIPDEFYVWQLNDLFGRQTGNVQEWSHGRIA